MVFINLNLLFYLLFWQIADNLIQSDLQLTQSKWLDAYVHINIHILHFFVFFVFVNINAIRK